LEGRTLRIGLVGTDSSHAEDFLSVLNAAERHPGFRIVALAGGETERMEALARRFGVSRIVADPAALVGEIDAAIIGDRDGGRHLRHALPFLEAGLPVFVDKPLACSLADAEAMLSAARRSGALITSASALRWQPDMEDLAARVRGLGGPLAVVTSGPLDPGSIHGGVFFYGIHAAELALQLAGADIVDVAVDRADPAVAVVTGRAGLVRVVVCLSRAAEERDPMFHAGVTCPGGMLSEPIRLAADYLTPVVDRFVGMLKTGRAPLAEAELLAPVRMLAALGVAMAAESRT
jgi:predicted dehydrogenase